MDTFTGGSDTTSAVTSVTTGTRTFWQTASTQLGTNFPALVDGTTTTYATGACWSVCSATDTAANCNGGVAYNGAASSNKDTSITGRVAMLVTNNGTTAIQSKGVNLKLFKWNIDILAPSFYHSAFAAASTTTYTGASWCSDFTNTLNSNGTATTLKAAKGFNGKSKCTWMVLGVSTKGPTF